MKIGCVKEIKHHEYRVGLTPSCVRSYVSRGHGVKMESGAGDAAGFTNKEYALAGAIISSDKKEIFDWSDMIVKVKKPLPQDIVDNVVHYCVANMPGVVALSSTQALTSTTIFYGLKIAESGLEEACRMNKDIRLGVNTYKGNIVYQNVAKAFNIPYVNMDTLL